MSCPAKIHYTDSIICLLHTTLPFWWIWKLFRFVIHEPLTNSLFATYSILLNFMWCNVRPFLPEWKCNSVSLCFVICQCCAYAMATKTFFLYNWQPALHLIIPVYIIFKTCAASFAGDWDLTKYWPLLKLAATSFSSEF